MYSLVNAYGLKRRVGAQWEAHDVASMSGAQMYATFVQLVLELHNSITNLPVHIEINEHRNIFGNTLDTVEDIVAAMDAETMVYNREPRTVETKRAIFSDAARAGYVAQRAKPGMHYTGIATDDYRTELQLSRPNTNMRNFVKSCLLSVNGFFYTGTATDDTLYVQNAGKSLLRSRMNTLGVLSFEDIGQISTHHLESDTVYPQAVGEPLARGIRVPGPNTDMTGKSLMLIVAGYLVLPGDGVFKNVGNHYYTINVANLHLTERFTESATFVDWSSITGSTNTQVVNPSILHSDDGLRKLIAHPQTFWVVVDCDELHRVTYPLSSLKLPGKFICPFEPTQMLTVGTGRGLEYWKVHQHGEWAVNTASMLGGDKVINTFARDDLGASAAATTLPYSVHKSYHANLVDIVAAKYV